jgi:hypothetical protein
MMEDGDPEDVQLQQGKRARDHRSSVPGSSKSTPRHNELIDAETAMNHFSRLKRADAQCQDSLAQA